VQLALITGQRIGENPLRFSTVMHQEGRRGVRLLL
jgi:hypothetical protein